MQNYNLSFISNENIYAHVKETVLKYKTFIDLKTFNSNVIDPIKLTFDAKVYGKSLEEIIESECVRQIDKGNTNHIGYFHQNLFKYAGNGWEVPTAGFDVVNEEQHIYCILKNSIDRMTNRQKLCVMIQMNDKLLQDKEAICLIVDRTDKSFTYTPWEWKDSEGIVHSNNRIFYASIDKLYELIFGDNDAYTKMLKILPNIIDDVLIDNHNE